MYLSRVEINPRLRATMLALSSPQRLHAIVAASFPSSLSALDSLAEVPEQQSVQQLVQQPAHRHLWRLDKLGHSLYVLAVSPLKPDFTHLIEQLGWAGSQQTWETKSYDPFLDRLQQGQEWQFRLRANPTYSDKKGNPSESRGVVRAHVKIEDQKQWFATRAQKYGFALSGFELVDRSISRFERQRKTVTLHIATFEGLLRVEEPELLREALTNGVGRAKAYGCGLLTLAKPHVGA
jgi:CRISPR system Cascade subunit CasE